MAKIAPSVLGADFSRLAEEIASTDKCQVDMLHLDIMDGHFVPNISFGPAIVKTINKLTDNFLDVHLMLFEPEKYFEAFQKAGADAITFHVEVHPDPVVHARTLKSMGVQAGLSINPNTPVDKVLPFLEYFDILLVMSVHPGFGGQSFVEAALPKVEAARKFIDSHKLATQILVDGGVDADNADRVAGAGADVLVMGSAFFKDPNRAVLTKKVQAL